MIKGELIVIGQNEVRIPLKRCPTNTKVHFKSNDHLIIPCMPDQMDFVMADIHHNHLGKFKYELVITWSVQSQKEIVWELDF